MKKLILILQLILMPLFLQASNYVNGYGLHGNTQRYVPSEHVLTLVISTNRYYGDVEKPLDKIYVIDPNVGYYPGNQMAGSISLQYAYHFCNYVAYRAQIDFGNLRGEVGYYRSSNKGQTEYLRKFSNTYVMYAMGVEVYPFHPIGLYVYVGIGGLTCINGYYDFNWQSEATRDHGSLKGNTVAILPIAIGYRHTIKCIQVGFEISWNPALMDSYTHNIDGYASKKYPVNPKTNAFNDGYFNIGISIGYILPIIP